MSNRDALEQHYNEVTQRVGEAAARAGKRAEDVLVVAVTKYASPDQIRQLMELGHADLGESRAQQLGQRVAMAEEFLARHREITSPRPSKLPESVRWHMIGSLQRNKVKQVLPLVRLIHSVDSLRLAEEIQTQAEKQGLVMDVLLQVNASGEKTKQGMSLPAAPHLVDQMATMDNVRVRGLMTMAPHTEDEQAIRYTFSRTAEVFEEMRNSGDCGDGFQILSMGMSEDYEIAIECGANLVRVGSALIGEAAEAAATE